MRVMYTSILMAWDQYDNVFLHKSISTWHKSHELVDIGFDFRMGLNWCLAVVIYSEFSN